MKSVIAALALVSLAACGTSPETSETKALSDAQRIDQRPDGKYDVTCRDGRHEVVTQADLQANNVCIPTAPGPGAVVLQDRSYNLSAFSYNSIMEVFGKGLWEGWLDFRIEVPGEGLKITDGAGGTYWVTTPRNFTRLKLPITFFDGASSSYSTAKITQIKADITRINDIPALNVAGKFNMTSPNPRTLIRTFGEDLVGVRMTFRVDARFYDNFDAGTGCGVVIVAGSDRNEILTVASAYQLLTLNGPINVYSDVSCTSSRKPTPQNATNDFEVGISSISLGNPI